MKFHRKERVNELFRDQLSVILIRELEFPGALVTITEVESTNDLDRAKVKVSVLPTKKANEVLKVLDSKRGMIQHLLNKKVNMRPMPQIYFEIDYGLERAAIIEKDLLEVEKLENK